MSCRNKIKNKTTERRKLKGWNVKLISVWVGEGLFEQEPALMIQKIKAKASKHFIPIIFGIHAKISACLSADPRVVEIYVHDTTDRFLSFFLPTTQPVCQKSLISRKANTKRKIKKTILSLPISLQQFAHLSTEMITIRLHHTEAKDTQVKSTLIKKKKINVKYKLNIVQHTFWVCPGASWRPLCQLRRGGGEGEGWGEWGPPARSVSVGGVNIVHSAWAEKKGRTRGDVAPAGEEREENRTRVASAEDLNQNLPPLAGPPPPFFFLLISCVLAIKGTNLQIHSRWARATGLLSPTPGWDSQPSRWSSSQMVWAEKAWIEATWFCHFLLIPCQPSRSPLSPSLGGGAKLVTVYHGWVFFFLSRVAKWLWKTAQRGP